MDESVLHTFLDIASKSKSAIYLKLQSSQSDISVVTITASLAGARGKF